MQFSVLFLLCSTAITSIFLPAEISPYEEKAFLCLIILYDIKIYKKFKSKTFPAPLKKVFRESSETNDHTVFENYRKSRIQHCELRSYVYILSGQKFIKNAKNGLILASTWKSEV